MKTSIYYCELERKILIKNNCQLTKKILSVIVKIAIHQNYRSDCIIINYPGFTEDIDDYKYITMANFMQKNIGAVIRMNNNYFSQLDYSKLIQDDLRIVIDYALENSKKICGVELPKIYLMGFSAGASAVSAIAYEYPEVQKILLISPSFDAGEEDIAKSLANYSGEIYILSGNNDEIISPDVAQEFSTLVKIASKHQVKILECCGHFFEGEKNSLILSNAPLWAFLGQNLGEE